MSKNTSASSGFRPLILPSSPAIILSMYVFRPSSLVRTSAGMNFLNLSWSIFTPRRGWIARFTMRRRSFMKSCEKSTGWIAASRGESE
jgi:hypothetical protein